MKAKCTLAGLIGLIVLATCAGQAVAATVKVRSVSAPRSATAGAVADVTVSVSRKGRARGGKVTFYLSADAKRDARDSRLAKVAAGVRIPAGQALGTYRVIACVAKSCAASRPMEVTESPVGTPELVERAVAAGKLTPQQGLVYRVFAAFGDRRLAGAYAGDNSEPEDTVMRDVAAGWAQLSKTQQKLLRPFLLPPAAPGSWMSRRAGASESAPGKCDSNQLADRNWRTIAKPGGHVRLWWLKGDEKFVGPSTRSLLADIENHMWPRLVAVFGREPLKDGGQRCFHGLDDKLDIYMLRLNKKIATTEAYPPDCKATPAFIVFDAGGHRPDRWEVAHELTHAFQFAYRYHDQCADHNNWDEAIANWGANWLYPDDNSEHVFRWLARDPEKPLPDASYEGWVFPYAMERLHGAGTIKDIYDQSEKLDLLESIDAGVPGGFRKAWPEFALAAWNQDPVSPNFLEWDHFPQGPEKDGKPIEAEKLDPGPAGQTVVDIPLAMKPLTRVYRRFKIGPGVTQITVEKPSFPDVSVQALIHTPGGGWKKELWGQGQPVFCPVEGKDRPDELVLVLAKSSFKQDSPQSPLRLIATNIGCNRYVGEASGSATFDQGTTHTTESWTATGLVYSRILADSVMAPRFLFNLTAGSVVWSMSGTDGTCSLKAGPATLPVQPSGYSGQLDIRSSTYPDESWARRYHAGAYGFGAIQGTVTCPTGTSTRWFAPRASILSTSDPNNMARVNPSGALEGTSSPWMGSGVTANYKWKLVPES